MYLKFILKVLIFVVLFLSLIAFVNSIGLNLNENPKPKRLLQVVTIETLENPRIIDNSKAFCDTHRGSSDETHGKLIM